MHSGNNHHHQHHHDDSHRQWLNNKITSIGSDDAIFGVTSSHSMMNGCSNNKDHQQEQRMVSMDGRNSEQIQSYNQQHHATTTCQHRPIINIDSREDRCTDNEVVVPPLASTKRSELLLEQQRPITSQQHQLPTSTNRRSSITPTTTPYPSNVGRAHYLEKRLCMDGFIKWGIPFPQGLPHTTTTTATASPVVVTATGGANDDHVRDTPIGPGEVVVLSDVTLIERLVWVRYQRDDVGTVVDCSRSNTGGTRKMDDGSNNTALKNAGTERPKTNTTGYWWPAILYQDYKEVASDATDFWNHLPLWTRLQLVYLMIFDVDNPRNQNCVARLLGRPGHELIEVPMDDHRNKGRDVGTDMNHKKVNRPIVADFYGHLTRILPSVAGKVEYFADHPDLYYDWHHGMDQVEALLGDCLGRPFPLSGEDDKMTWVERARRAERIRWRAHARYVGCLFPLLCPAEPDDDVHQQIMQVDALKQRSKDGDKSNNRVPAGEQPPPTTSPLSKRDKVQTAMKPQVAVKSGKRLKLRFKKT